MRQLIAFFFALIAMSTNVVALDTSMVAASYSVPVERYGHFALGRPHEYARLTATTGAGAELVFDLPLSEVFEDLRPRLVRLAPTEPMQILSIVSSRDNGARLVLFGQSANGGLEIRAQSAAIGTPMRWLNPVAVTDLDQDGRAEIAAVITPHIGGTLKLYQQRGDALVVMGEMQGFSNHVYGTPELALSTALAINGSMRLLVPDTSRRQLRIIAWREGQLLETGRCKLSSPVTGAISVVSDSTVSIGTAGGSMLIDLARCAN